MYPPAKSEDYIALSCNQAAALMWMVDGIGAC